MKRFIAALLVIIAALHADAQVSAGGGVTYSPNVVTGSLTVTNGTPTPGPGAFTVISTSVNGGGTNSAWSNKYSVFGPNAGSTTGAALGLGYDTSTNSSVISSIAPGSAWEALSIFSASVTFFPSGATSSFALNQNSSVSIASPIVIGTTFTLGAGTGACATTSTLTGGGAAGSFLCTGTAGASTQVVNLPNTPTHGWACWANDDTSKVSWAAGANTTSTVTLSGTITTTSDKVVFGCIGY